METAWRAPLQFSLTYEGALRLIETSGVGDEYDKWIVEFTVGEKWYTLSKVGDAIALRKIMDAPFTL